MTSAARRITASHVGVSVAPELGLRTCLRCGCQRNVNTRRVDPRKPYMCGDCKRVDPQWAKRLGLP